jgi:hypothetical protein
MLKVHEYNLSEISRLLGEPQHRLIYLCEKGVVTPDFGGASGRGSSRRFSVRNVLEFSLALKVREFLLPVPVVKAILHVLRQFEEIMNQERPGFRLPASLRAPEAPILRVVVGDGPRLWFTLGPEDGPGKAFGGIDLKKLLGAESFAVISPDEPDDRAGVARFLSHSGNGGATVALSKGQKMRLEIDVSRIAQDLPIDE